MELPFSPHFFSKLNTYQTLKDFEGCGDPTWQAEKLILSNATSPDNRRSRASWLNKGHVSTILINYPIDLLPRASSTSLIDPIAAMESLVVRGFAERHSQTPAIRLNAQGLLAGKVLDETKLMTHVGEYEKWIDRWWAAYRLGFALLTLSVVSAFVKLLLNLRDLYFR